MQGFDITSLLKFAPPKYVCSSCGGIFTSGQEFFSEGQNIIKCPICSYRSGKEWDHRQQVSTDNIVDHGRNLAQIAGTLGEQGYSPTGMRAYTVTPTLLMFRALSKARSFVHFSTYGIDAMWFGALKMLAQRIWVRGIVSNLERGNLILRIIEEDRYAESELGINVFGSEADAPHVKFVIVDGLLLIKGSVNLTFSGLRTKAEQYRDSFEIITNIDEIREYNNRYFSSTWRAQNAWPGEYES